jgi:hypothetical protein
VEAHIGCSRHFDGQLGIADLSPRMRRSSGLIGVIDMTTLTKTAAGLPPMFVLDKGRTHQQLQFPLLKADRIQFRHG